MAEGTHAKFAAHHLLVVEAVTGLSSWCCDAKTSGEALATSHKISWALSDQPVIAGESNIRMRQSDRDENRCQPR